MDSNAYLHWMSKLSRPRGQSITNSEYYKSLEILQREFGPYVVGGFTELQDVLVDVDWDKSPGWPYVNLGCTTKRQAWDKYSAEITQAAQHLIYGEYVESTFIASLKDELLPPGKKARVFLPAPFHHQLACAMLFKKASDSLTASCHKHSSAIGINLFGGGLERALRQLSQLPYGYDADQSGCDTSCKDVEPERDFMKTGLPACYHAGVDLLFNQACCPQVIVGDRILQLTMNPSGWYLTTVLNTLRTHRLVATAYLDLSPMHTIDDMRRHLHQLNGGDDLAFATDQSWFTIAALSNELARKGVYLESDHLLPRDPMSLTFFSHNLFLRRVDYLDSYVYAAGGRLSKILSSFSYLKTNDGKINWCRNASRVVGLMVNLWPYKFEFDQLYSYLYHMIHHFFLLDGGVLTSEWSGVFRSIPSDPLMMLLRSGASRESVFFFPPHNCSSNSVKRVFQSALKDPASSSHFDTMSKTDHSTRQVDNILNRLEKAHGLSKAGRDWLVAAVDPFHDFDVQLAGYPDVTTDASLVQMVPQQFTVSVSSGPDGGITLPTNGTWDCRIDLFPDLINSSLQVRAEYSNTNRFVSGSSLASSCFLGGVSAHGAVSGTALDPGAAICLGGVTPANWLNDGNIRLIGAAIEVNNTTADIAKQGAVTVSRKPAVITRKQFFSNPALITGTGSQYYAFDFMDVPLPPSTVDDAKRFYGSRTWKAEEGCYLVGRLNGTNNPFKQNYPDTRVCIANSQPDPTKIVYYTPFNTSVTNASSASFVVPYDISTAYFTGLSEQTTLDVQVRWIFERQPQYDLNLTTLVTPAAGYDPLALEIYTRCLADMPPGCRISENPLGEWFRKALTGVSKWAPKIGDALNTVIPGAGLLGKAIGQGATLIMPKEKKKQPEEEKTEVTEIITKPSTPRRSILPASTTEVITKKMGGNRKRIIYKKK